MQDLPTFPNKNIQLTLLSNFHRSIHELPWMSHEKNPALLSMSHPGWLIGILIMVYEIIPKKNWVGNFIP